MIAGLGAVAAGTAVGLGGAGTVRALGPTDPRGAARLDAAGATQLEHGYDAHVQEALRAHGLEAPDAEVRQLFDGLRPGTVLEQKVRIDAIYGVRAGGIPVVLRANGGSFLVEVFRNHTSDAPLVVAGAFGLFLSSRGAEVDPVGHAATLVLGRALEGADAIPSALRARCEVPRDFIQTYAVPVEPVAGAGPDSVL